jgi:hypothetical protein
MVLETNSQGAVDYFSMAKNNDKKQLHIKFYMYLFHIRTKQQVNNRVNKKTHKRIYLVWFTCQQISNVV